MRSSRRLPPRRIPRALVPAASLLLVVAPLVLATLPVSAQAFFPTIVLSPMDPSIVRITPSATQDQTAKYTSQLNVTKPPFGTCSVSLNTSVTLGFPATTEPAQATFTGDGGSQLITVTVTIPRGQTSHALGNVTLEAHAGSCYGVQSSASSDGQLEILPRWAFSFVSKSAGAASRTEVAGAVRVKNIGVDSDSFGIRVKQVKYQSDLTIKAGSPTVDSVSIAAGAEGNVSFRLPITLTGSGQRVEIVFATRSEGAAAAKSNVSADISLAWNVPPPTKEDLKKNPATGGNTTAPPTTKKFIPLLGDQGILAAGAVLAIAGVLPRHGRVCSSPTRRPGPLRRR